MTRRRSERSALLILVVASFLSMTGFGSVLPVLPLFVRRHGVPLAWMGWLAAAYAAAGFLGQVPLGALSDRVGRRPIIVAGLAAGGLTFLGFLLRLPPWAYVGLRAAQGLGGAAVGPASAALVADLAPEEERGQAYGWLGSGSMAGFVAGPAIGGVLTALLGMSAAFAAGAGASLLGALLATRLPPGGGRRGARAAGPRASVRLARSLWPLLVLNFGWLGLLGMYDTAWSLYLTHLGASQWVVGLSFAAFSLPMVVLQVPAGRLADRLRRKEAALVAGAGVIALSVLGYGLARRVAVAIAVSLVEATVTSLVSPLLNAVLAERSPPERLGEAQGLLASAATAGSFLTAVVSGYLLPVGYNVPFLFGAALLGAAGAVAAVGLRRRRAVRSP